MNRSKVVTHLKRYYHQPGTAPGVLVAPPGANNDDCAIRVIKYSQDSFSEQLATGVNDCYPPINPNQVTWINIEGNYQPELLRKLSEYYQLHFLSLEDTLNRGHRPKLEEYQGYLFIILYMLERQEQAVDQQVSIFVTGNVLITLQANEYQSFELLRQRLRSPQNGDDIREYGIDYLTYAVCDTLIDQFFPRLETYRERLELLEEHLIVQNPPSELLAEIHQLKSEMLVLSRLAWAERDVIASLDRQHPHLKEYLRDTYDHMVQIIEMLETYRDITTGLLDVYLSSVSNQMNNVMKTLTIIATIFIPLTFIVGVYGMNFNTASPLNMPELNTRFGYLAVWAVMLAIAGGMLFWFRRKKWL